MGCWGGGVWLWGYFMEFCVVGWVYGIRIGLVRLSFRFVVVFW